MAERILASKGLLNGAGGTGGDGGVPGKVSEEKEEQGEERGQVVRDMTE